MENKSDLEEYLQDLLDLSNRKHQEFIQELLKRWRPKGREIQPSIPDGFVVSSFNHLLLCVCFISSIM